jgi:uncharacterized membrane protein (UPF0127 family)
MMQRVHLHHPRIVVAVSAIVLLVVACGGTTATAPPASPSPSPSLTPEATTTVEPSATATATAISTPEPRFDDRIASTALIPLADLDEVEFVSEGGRTRLSIEVPARSEYGIGLSGRYQLADRGMLFYYAEGNRGGFWMRNTHIDLDIAFVDFNLRIIDILRMEAETETIHSPGELYLAAIEAPAGWYEAASIETGDTVVFPFDVDAALAAATAALAE